VIARRGRLTTALAVSCAAAVAGCGLFGGKPPEPPPPLVYTLCLEASPTLNWYNDTPNTLYVRAYQLSAPDAFVQTDPARMVEPGFTLAGAEGAPIEKTIFPGTKTMVQIRQQPQATTLGVVAFYYEATGPVKARRPLLKRDDTSEKPQPAACVVLGANGIESR
jgi:type VI secretion system VasD/TssJ family lipoprotein